MSFIHTAFGGTLPSAVHTSAEEQKIEHLPAIALKLIFF
jgi:hypothetical protein